MYAACARDAVQVFANGAFTVAGVFWAKRMALVFLPRLAGVEPMSAIAGAMVDMLVLAAVVFLVSHVWRVVHVLHLASPVGKLGWHKPAQLQLRTSSDVARKLVHLFTSMREATATRRSSSSVLSLSSALSVVNASLTAGSTMLAFVKEGITCTLDFVVPVRTAPRAACTQAQCCYRSRRRACACCCEQVTVPEATRFSLPKVGLEVRVLTKSAFLGRSFIHEGAVIARASTPGAISVGHSGETHDIVQAANVSVNLEIVGPAIALATLGACGLQVDLVVDMGEVSPAQTLTLARVVDGKVETSAESPLCDGKFMDEISKLAFVGEILHNFSMEELVERLEAAVTGTLPSQASLPSCSPCQCQSCDGCRRDRRRAARCCALVLGCDGSRPLRLRGAQGTCLHKVLVHHAALCLMSLSHSDANTSSATCTRRCWRA